MRRLGVNAKVYRRSSGVLWRAGLGQVIVLSQHEEDPLMLTGAGVAIWSALATPHSVESLVNELADRFDVSPGQISAALQPTIAELVDHHVIEPVDAP